MESKMNTVQARTFVAVHGVGRQLELETVRALIEGPRIDQAPRAKYTLQQLAAMSEWTPGLIVDETGQFAEVRYSHLIEAHESYSERDLNHWIGTFRGRLEAIHRRRGIHPMPNFSGIELVIDDILLTSRVARFLAERLKVSTLSFESSAQAFLQQIQLFVDRRSYRNTICESVRKQLANLAALDPASKLVLATHSLGTVVTFMALLQAQEDHEPWLAQVERFVTFGSPVDLFVVLFEEFFPVVQTSDRNIPWTNFTLLNDPITTDLKVTSESFLPNNAPGLFENNSVEEVVLGAGSIVSAHTDYWHHLGMLQNIYEPAISRLSQSKDAGSPNESGISSATDELAPLQRHRSGWWERVPISGFALLGCIAVLAAAWVGLIWWEENLKVQDTDRILVLDSPPLQLLLWLGLALMIFCHAVSWSSSRTGRVLGFLGSAAISVVLSFILPGLSLCGEPPAEAPSGNTILFFVPLSALVGIFRVGHRLRPRIVLGFLAVLVVFLSLFVGTRTAPSNITEEFGTLGLVFGFWLFAILLFRTHRVYRVYVRGRKHIDILHDLWNKKTGKDDAEPPTGGDGNPAPQP